jgi:CAAX protease family protein
LVLTIVAVAPAEELLYRSYAIERLTDLTGSPAIAVGISVLVFGLAHVPMWGWGPSMTTCLAGGIMTIVYLWRRDVVALSVAHIAADLYGIAFAS